MGTHNDLTPIKSRIVGYDTKPADQFNAHPHNWRKHPMRQREAVAASLRELGWIAPVIENRQTGNLIDGHERVWQALQRGEDVPYMVVDLSPEEEALALATFDAITGMAETDAAALDRLLAEVSTGEAALMELIAETAADVTIPGGDAWGDAFGKLPDEDRAPFQQMTFTLHDDQAEVVRAALSTAKGLGPFADTGNENSNGNALARICEMFAGDYGQG